MIGRRTQTCLPDRCNREHHRFVFIFFFVLLSFWCATLVRLTMVSLFQFYLYHWWWSLCSFSLYLSLSPSWPVKCSSLCATFSTCTTPDVTIDARIHFNNTQNIEHAHKKKITIFSALDACLRHQDWIKCVCESVSVFLSWRTSFRCLLFK